MTSSPYEYTDPEYGKTTGGGIIVSADKTDELPQIWILRRDHAFNNPVSYLNARFQYYVYFVSEYDYYDYEVTGIELCRIGGITLFSNTFRFLTEEEQELYREIRLIPYRDDGGVEFGARYTAENEETVMSLLDTVISNYCPDKEPEKAEAVIRPLTEASDLLNGIYGVRTEDIDKIGTEGYFTAVLYTLAHYAAEDVLSLKSGDTIEINDRVYTIADVMPWEDGTDWRGIDLIPEEEAPEQNFAGFCFGKGEEGDGQDYVLYAMTGAWLALSRVASVRIGYPLLHPVAYYDVSEALAPTLEAEDLLADDAGISVLTRMTPDEYEFEFRNGELTRIYYRDNAWTNPGDPFVPVVTK